MRLISFIFLLCLVLITISFALLNSQIVTVNYLFSIRELPLSLLMLCTLTLGCLFGLAVQLKILLQYRYRLYELNKKVTLLNQEVNNLRALPVKDTDL